jgi:tellurite resistance protein TerC
MDGISKYIIFNIIIAICIGIDLFSNRGKKPCYKNALISTFVWVLVSFLFCIYIYYTRCADDALLFLSGYFIEKSLSLDNIMVFVIIFSAFKIPEDQQTRLLMLGVLGAIVMRAIMIFGAYELIMAWDFVLKIMGAFLIWTGYKMFRTDHETNIEDSFVFKKILQRVDFKTTSKNFFVKNDNKYFMTPYFAALVAIETTDLVFAIDSIPAIFAITKDPYIVYTSNIFAILGLRALFIVLSKGVQDFPYLQLSLGVILIFVGLKLLGIFHPAPLVSFGIIATLLTMGIVGSIVKTRLDKKSG